MEAYINLEILGHNIMDFLAEQSTKQQPFSERAFVVEILKKGL